MELLEHKKSLLEKRPNTMVLAPQASYSLPDQNMENNATRSRMTTSHRVEISRFIKEEFRSTTSRMSNSFRKTAASRSSSKQFSRSSVEEFRGSLVNEGFNAALRRVATLNNSTGRSLFTNASNLSSLVLRCVNTAEVSSHSFILFYKLVSLDHAPQYPGNINRLVAELLLKVSHEEHFSDSILADLNESIEMLNNFGFPINGDVA